MRDNTTRLVVRGRRWCQTAQHTRTRACHVPRTKAVTGTARLERAARARNMVCCGSVSSAQGECDLATWKRRKRGHFQNPFFVVFQTSAPPAAARYNSPIRGITRLDARHVMLVRLARRLRLMMAILPVVHFRGHGRGLKGAIDSEPRGSLATLLLRLDS